MEFSTAVYVRLKREGGQISLRPLATLASAFAKRPITVRWGTWADNDMPSGWLGQWSPTGNEIVLHRSLGWGLDQRLPEVFLHELGHCLLPKRNKSQEAREAEADRFAAMTLRRVGPDFVWWLIGGGVDHEA